MYDSIYRSARWRIAQTVGVLGPDDLGLSVPACPEWTVRELVAHLVGAAADLAGGRMDGAPAPSWTARHVDERRYRTPAQNLAEWEDTAATVEAELSRPGGLTALAFDVVQHEGDLYGALCVGRPPDPAWRTLLMQVAQRLQSNANPASPVTLLTEDGAWRLGEGGEGTTAQVGAYELWRAMFGRRSRRQMSAWRWDGPAEPHLDVITIFPPRDDDLVD